MPKKGSLKKRLKKVPLLERRKRVLSKHPSHKVFRKALPVIKGLKYVVRLGSTTELPDVKSKGGDRIEINTVESIKNSMDKLKMKKCFNQANAKTAQWWYSKDGNIFLENANDNNKVNKENLPFPIIAKHRFGSRGTGNYMLNSYVELEKWIKGKELSKYIFERFYTYTKEYRLHISENGCFYTCRKMLKTDTPDDKKWQRHDDNCVWIIEENALFDKPINWNDIVNDCVNALKSIGADVLGFDVKVQSTLDSNKKPRKYCDYILIECNSASSHGDLTSEKYIQEIPKLINQKRNK